MPLQRSTFGQKFVIKFDVNITYELTDFWLPDIKFAVFNPQYNSHSLKYYNLLKHLQYIVNSALHRDLLQNFMQRYRAQYRAIWTLFMLMW